MKKIALAVAALAIFGSASVSAQTCTANAAFPSVPDAGGPVVVNGDSCTGATNQLNASCSDANPIGAANDYVYSFNLGTGASGNASLAPTGWDAYLAIMAASCASTATCPTESENGGNGVTEQVNFTGIAAGSYFLLVSSFAAAGNCGPFALTITPTLPVSLQKFSVE